MPALFFPLSPQMMLTESEANSRVKGSECGRVQHCRYYSVFARAAR